MTPRNQGFTLIELLVVIAVILILASLTMPVLDRALYQARKTECLNHLRQIGSAMQMYAGQNNRRFPPHQPGGGPHWNDGATRALVPTYLNNPELFYCPLSYPRYNPRKYWKERNNGWWTACDYVWGYQYMGNYHKSGIALFPDDSIVPKVWGQQEAGPTLALIQDVVWHSVGDGLYNGGHPGRSFDPRPPEDVNVFFVDGRVENWRFEKLTHRAGNGGSYYYWP